MIKKKLFILLTLNLLFLSGFIIREWNHRLWNSETAIIRHKDEPVESELHTLPSQLPLQDSLLTRERQIAASRAKFDPVRFHTLKTQSKPWST